MADFTFVRGLNGTTPQTELVTAGGAMEVGDFVIAGGDNNEGIATTVTKAGGNPTRATLVGICLGKHQEDGTAIASGDLVQMLPITADILIQGKAIDATLANVNVAVGIDVTSTVQTFEAAETNKVGKIYKVVDATNKIVQVRMAAV